MYKKVIIFMFIVFACLQGAVYPNNEEAVIERIETALSAFDVSAFTVETAMSINNPEIQPNMIKRKSRIYRNSNQWSTSFKDTFEKDDEIREISGGQLIDNKGYYFTQEPDDIDFQVFASSDIDKVHKAAIGTLGGSIVFLGQQFWLDDIKWIDILKQNELTIQEVSTDSSGRNLLLLEANDSKYGIYKIWVDPTKNYLPVKMHCIKNKQHFKSIGGNKLDHTGLELFEYIVENVKIEEVGGDFIVRSANVYEKRRYQGGGDIVMTYDFSISEVDLNPDFEKLNVFKLGVPDGTPVVDEDFPGLSFEVFEGKVVSGIRPFGVDKYLDDALNSLPEQSLVHKTKKVETTSIESPKSTVQIKTKIEKESDAHKDSGHINFLVCGVFAVFFVFVFYGIFQKVKKNMQI